MKQELSQQIFQSRLQTINELYSYVDMKQGNDYVMLVIHQHFGISNYLRLIAHGLCNNQVSIVMPNLFQVDQADQVQANDIDYLKNLNHSDILKKMYELATYLQKSNKKIILVGFSIGAAIALKFLQFYKNIQFSMIFYGFPFLQNVKPERILTRTCIYVGKNDKIKYLSDKKVVEAAKNIYSSNNLIKIIQFNEAKHGFMNPLSQNYNKKLFDQCTKEFKMNLELSIQQISQKSIAKRIKSNKKLQKNENLERNDKVNQQRGEEMENNQELEIKKQQNKDNCILI